VLEIISKENEERKYRLGIVVQGVRYILDHLYPASDLLLLPVASFHHQLIYPSESGAQQRAALWSTITVKFPLQSAYKWYINTPPKCCVCSCLIPDAMESTNCARCHLIMHESDSCSMSDQIKGIYCSERCELLTEAVFAVEITGKSGASGKKPVRYHIRMVNHAIQEIPVAHFHKNIKDTSLVKRFTLMNSSGEPTEQEHEIDPPTQSLADEEIGERSPEKSRMQPLLSSFSEAPSVSTGSLHSEEPMTSPPSIHSEKSSTLSSHKFEKIDIKKMLSSIRNPVSARQKAK
jgi:hypothetical protein